ncbi:MAG: phospho-sugar mutase [Candidatus Lernaella stagnicola]|nr:phospho-sugar mutase [Candidatus Lernaella stagnicola]
MADHLERYLALLNFYRDSGEITDETYQNAKMWLTDPRFADFQRDVIALIRPTALIDAFYQIIPFGTGGRRGTVGTGSNRMNARTVGESAQGLASYIIRQDNGGALAERGVAIAYDVRNSSEEFAHLTAEVLAGNGIRVLLFDSPRSTPLLSFAVRHLPTTAGVVITASHNPPTDNGFKAYWQDGGQIVAPHDVAILEEVKAVTDIARLDFDTAKEKGLVAMLGSEVDEAYFAMMERDLNFCDERAAKIVYSPLHGTGSTIVTPLLERFGFHDVHVPENQIPMDGNFPTVPRNYPNPEDPDAMAVAVALAKQIDADVVLASDPDGDRLGVFVPAGGGEYIYLTGNEFQPLMLDFVVSRLQTAGSVSQQAYICTTQVTTKMIRAVAESFGVEVVDNLLVGFKNVAFEILSREGRGVAPENMIFACEESIGYMMHHEVRDKDSASAAVIAAQMTAFYKSEGKSLLDRLHELYDEHGYFFNKGFSVFLHGAAGQTQMAQLMDRLRREPPREIAGLPVVRITDRLQDTELDMSTGEKKPLGLAQSNVVVYQLIEGGGRTTVSIRPSGTEPKIKHYIAHYGPSEQQEAVQEKGRELETAVRDLEQQILKTL